MAGGGRGWLMVDDQERVRELAAQIKPIYSLLTTSYWPVWS